MVKFRIISAFLLLSISIACGTEVFAHALKRTQQDFESSTNHLPKRLPTGHLYEQKATTTQINNKIERTTTTSYGSLPLGQKTYSKIAKDLTLQERSLANSVLPSCPDLKDNGIIRYWHLKVRYDNLLAHLNLINTDPRGSYFLRYEESVNTPLAQKKPPTVHRRAYRKTLTAERKSLKRAAPAKRKALKREIRVNRKATPAKRKALRREARTKRRTVRRHR